MGLKVILCFLLNLNILLALDVGDSCVPNINYDNGTCSLVTQCEIAMRQIKIKGSQDFAHCGYEGIIEIVCCPIPIPIPIPDRRFGITGSAMTNSLRIADRECKKLMDSANIAVGEYIIGGEPATLGEFPHMVAIGYYIDNSYKFNCGGSVISNNFVITAAHCIFTRDEIQPSLVRAGVVDIGNDAWDKTTDIGIAEVIPHPEYSRNESYHDLALLRLNKSLVFTSNLNAACLHTSNNLPSLPLTITGWGTINTTRDVRSPVLMKAAVSGVSIKNCRKHYKNWLKLPKGIVDTQVCASDPTGNQDTCLGDSGGPLQALDKKNVHIVAGITSFGRGCGSSLPAVYTRVAAYIDWIESVVWPQ